MRTFSSTKPPAKGTRASILVHGITGTGKTTRALTGGVPLVICTEPKAETHILKLNPNAVCVVPESCGDLLKVMEQLTSPGFIDKGYTRIVLDSYTELTQSLANWILVHESGNPNVEIGRKLNIDEYKPIADWAMSVIKAIQRSGLPSIIICRSEAKEMGRIQKIVPAGLGSSAKNLPAHLVPTVEARFDDELQGYVWDCRPDEFSQRCPLQWIPKVWTGTADDFLYLVENGKADAQPLEQPEAPAVKIKRKRKEQQPSQPETVAPFQPQPSQPQPVPLNVTVASQEEIGNEPEPDNDQTISREQQSQVWDYLDNYKVDPAAFLQWAASRGLLVTDSPNASIADIRLDQFSYIQSLFQHDRSRGQFLQHLNNLARKTA